MAFVYLISKSKMMMIITVQSISTLTAYQPTNQSIKYIKLIINQYDFSFTGN